MNRLSQLTLPKFNSEFSPEKLPFHPIGKEKVFQPSMAFRGELLNIDPESIHKMVVGRLLSYWEGNFSGASC